MPFIYQREQPILIKEVMVNASQQSINGVDLMLIYAPRKKDH